MTTEQMVKPKEPPKADESGIVHQRYYIEEGGKKIQVPGVTTILGVLNKPALVIWANRMGLEGIDTTKYVKTESDVGTICHKMIEADIKGEEFDDSLYAPADISRAENGFIRWLDWKEENHLEPIESELQLSSSSFRYGGTCDIYCKLNGKLTLLDVKTSSGIYDEMKHQVAAYRQLVIESGREVEQVGILRVGKEEVGDLDLVMVGKLEEHFKLFLKCIEIYELRKKIRRKK